MAEAGGPKLHTDADVDRIVARRVAEYEQRNVVDALSAELTGVINSLGRLEKEMSRLAKEASGVRHWMASTDKKLEENNHLRRDMATKKDLEALLGRVLMRTDLPDGDFYIQVADGIMFSRDELKAAAVAADAADLAAKNAAAQAVDQVRRERAIQYRMAIWMAIAACVGTLVGVGSLTIAVLSYLHAIHKI